MADPDVSPVFFNPLAADYLDNPYPHLAEVRSQDPVHWTLAELWGLFAYEDVFRLLRDSSLSVDERNMTQTDRGHQFETIADEESIELTPGTSMLDVDPPDHTRLRRLVSKAFTPNTIERLRPRIQELVDRSLDAMAAANGGDLVEELAFTLPFDVISEMLGLPEADKVKVRGWSEDIVKTLDPIVTDADIRAALTSGQQMDRHIDGVVERKRANPADDLLTKMIEAEEDGDRLSAIELRDQVALLFIAGHETTVNLIGTGIYELLRHPEQLQRWRDDASLDASSVDELLRYVTPVQMSRRITTADIEFGGKEIAKGSMVMAMLSSANHDPDKFGPSADQLDLGRTDAGQHLSFGSGAHFCLGSSLAKLEAQIAIGSFVRRFANAKVVGSSWNGRLNLRGLRQLHLSL